VPEVQVERQGGHIVLSVKRTDPAPVKLLTLLSKMTGPAAKQLPPCTATLGLCDDGAPLLARLPSKDVGHVLVIGSGASSLLQTMAVSLAVCNRPRDLRLVIVGRELGDLARLPHVLSYATDNGQADKAMSAIARRAGMYLGRTELAPRVVVMIDGLADIVPGGTLARLLNDGHAAGVHLVASGSVASAGFGTLIQGDKVTSGDFEVTTGGQVFRFTAATITPAEVNQVVIGAMPKREPTRLHQAAVLVAGG
jgi:hypothetical protein